MYRASMTFLLKFSIFFTLSAVLIRGGVSSEDEQPAVLILSETNTKAYYNHESSKADSRKPSIYCYLGARKEIASIWKTVSISLSLNNDLFEQFEGASAAEVMKNFKKHQSSWSINIFSFWKQKLIKLDPFNTTCIGILTSKSYSVTLIVNDVNYLQLLKFISGMVLFYYAQILSQNQIFYYLCGISLGICGSVVILIYLISRLFPNKSLMYGLTISGWTLSFYFLQYLLDNAKLIVLQYKQYVLSYIAVSGIISFAICYRFGPLTNPRSRNLIQWSLQIAALLLIFYSSYLYEVTYMIDLLLFLSRILPISWMLSGLLFIKRKVFRPKVKLLSKKEYLEQGRKETKKALEELRGYCSSPECNPWKTVLRLKNPVKFAEFMEGSNHLSDDEVDAYDSLCIKPNGTIITDDSDSVAEYSEDD